MGFAILAFISVFVLLGSVGVLLFVRTGMMERVSSALSPGEGGKWSDWFRGMDAGTSLKAVVQPFEKILPKSPKEVSIIQKRLIRAGYREDNHVRIFYGSKVLVPLLLAGLITVTGINQEFGFFSYALALGLGFLLPDFWLGRQIAKRELNIRLGLPEFLDLLVVCIEAGLSMDQALIRTVQELRLSQPAISDEFGLVVLEQKAGRPRVDAWRHLAERADIDVIRALVSALIQADQFGTSVSKILRVHSDTLRTQRRQKVEEEAAKTAIKLVFPLVFFIFPSLFVVTLGPAMIIIGESFQKYFSK